MLMVKCSKTLNVGGPNCFEEVGGGRQASKRSWALTWLLQSGGVGNCLLPVNRKRPDPREHAMNTVIYQCI